ncbi:MAG: hypothetical protein [Circular genetic element sp.]|nr:MAG: hypothetical protein [Circular genetic element sp.]
MIALSITAKNATQSVENLTKGVGNLMTPVLSASVAGVACALGIIAYYESSLQDKLDRKPTGVSNTPPTDSGYTDWEQVPGVVWGAPESPEAEAIRLEKERNWKMKVNRFTTAISTQIMNLAGKV